MLTSFVDLFRTREEEAADTIAELVRRVVDGTNVPADELVRAAKDAGMTAEDVDAMARRMRVRDQLRQTALNGDAATAEIDKLAEAIDKHDRALAEAHRRHQIAVEPLNDQMAAARARLADATAAENGLLSPENMEPHILERLNAARAELHNTSVAVNALRTEEREQTRRHEEAAAEMAERKIDPAQVGELWRNEATRHKVSSRDERVFLDWMRGRRRATEAAEKLPAALEAFHAAEEKVADIEAEARAS